MSRRGFLHSGVLFLLGSFLAACDASPPANNPIDYYRSGGFAGFDDHLQLAATGKAVVTRRNKAYEGTVDAGQMEQIRALLDKADFTHLANEYLPARPGADLIEYTLTYTGHSVRTMDSATPPALQPLLAVLNSIVDSIGK